MSSPETRPVVVVSGEMNLTVFANLKMFRFLKTKQSHCVVSRPLILNIVQNCSLQVIVRYVDFFCYFSEKLAAHTYIDT